MKQGFTLIELLVVVLIIGILASVALPQYQKAVLKSRTVEALVTLNTLEKAQEIYYLENGEYTNELEDLDVEIELPPYASLTYEFAHFPIRDGLSLEWVWSRAGMGKYKDSLHRCIAATPKAHSICQSFGGQAINHSSNTETKTYYALP